LQSFDDSSHGYVERFLSVIAGCMVTNTLAASVATELTVTREQMEEYRKELELYNLARQRFDDDTAKYWKAVSDKRKVRNSKRRNNQGLVVDDYVLNPAANLYWPTASSRSVSAGTGKASRGRKVHTCVYRKRHP
jgi:hypothetical protein